MAKKLSQAATEQLQNCTIDGNILYLPKDKFLSRNIFLEIRNKLNSVGAKYKSGTGFQFPEDPTKILAAILEGNDQDLIVDVDLLSTPDAEAAMLVLLAGIKQEHSICEPSAGSGAIIRAIQKVLPNKSVHWYEKKESLARIVDEMPYTIFHGFNFLEDDPDSFDRIIACPPLTKHQDMKHVLRMFYKLRPKGRVVSIMSTEWTTSDYSACINFRAWLKEMKATIVVNPPSFFMAGATPLPTCTVIINKP